MPGNPNYKPSWLVIILQSNLSDFLSNHLTGVKVQDAIKTFINRTSAFLVWSYLEKKRERLTRRDEKGNPYFYLPIISFNFYSPTTTDRCFQMGQEVDKILPGHDSGLCQPSS
jgi:hypothetical protein